MRQDIYQINVQCDGCKPGLLRRKAAAAVLDDDLTKCLQQLKAKGWRLGKKRDYCPKCAEQRPARTIRAVK